MSYGKQLLAVICLLCYQQGLECMKHKIARPHPSLSESGSTSILVNVTVQYNETLTAASKLVAIRPGLSVLGAIREAALDFLHDNPDQTNYFNIRYARSPRHRCDVIVMAMTTPNKAYRRWIVLVENNSGQTIYRGPCLYSRRRLLIFPGYKIVLSTWPGQTADLASTPLPAV